MRTNEIPVLPQRIIRVIREIRVQTTQRIIRVLFQRIIRVIREISVQTTQRIIRVFPSQQAFNTRCNHVIPQPYSTIKKRFNLVHRGRVSIALSRSTTITTTRRGAGEARVDDLLRARIVGTKHAQRPAHNHLLREAALGEHVAYAHDVIVMAGGLKLIALTGEHGSYKTVIIGLYALHLLLFLALLGMLTGGSGHLVEGERLCLVGVSEEHVGVMGYAAETGNVFTLHVGLHAKELLIIGVACIERCLILLKNVVAHPVGLALGLLVTEDYAEAVAADGGVTHHGVGVACYLASQR